MTMNTQKVLYFVHAGPDLYDLVRSHVPEGWTLVTLDTNGEQERLDKIADVDVVVLAGPKLERKYINAASKLRLVHYQGVGYHESADFEALRERGIPFAIAPGGTAESVSEHTIMLMISAYKLGGFVDAEIRRGIWHNHDLRAQSRQIYDKTVGILGMGRVGRAVARRLKPFGARIIYHDIEDVPPQIQEECNARPVGFDELLASSDILTLHAPETALTKNIINARTLGQMRRGAYLVNCARGGLVDEAALLDALKSGHLGGAGLDVRVSEPPPFPDPFNDLVNVVMTPHTAAGNLDAMHMKMADVFANVRRLETGQPLLDTVP